MLDAGLRFIEKHARWLPAFVLIYSILINLAFLTLIPRIMTDTALPPDYSRYYLPVGRSIADGDGFYTSAGEPAVRYPPGFPIIVAGTLLVSDNLPVPHSTVENGVIIVFSALSAVLLFWLARLFWSDLSSLAVVLLWTLNPIQLWSIRQPLSTIPFLTFFLAAILLAAIAVSSTRRLWLLYSLSGAMVGVSMLIRPASIGLSLLLCGLMALVITANRRRHWVLSVLLLISNLIVVAPWQIWLNSHTDSYALLSIGGPRSMINGLTYSFTENTASTDNLSTDVLIFQMKILMNADQLTTYPDLARFLAENAVDQPKTVFKLFAVKAGRSWYGTDSRRYESLIILVQVAFLGAVLSGAIGVWRKHPARRVMLILVGGIMFYFWGMTIMVLSIVRYMLPAMILLTLLIPGMWTRLSRKSAV